MVVFPRCVEIGSYACFLLEWAAMSMVVTVLTEMETSGIVDVKWVLAQKHSQVINRYSINYMHLLNVHKYVLSV